MLIVECCAAEQTEDQDVTLSYVTVPQSIVSLATNIEPITTKPIQRGDLEVYRWDWHGGLLKSSFTFTYDNSTHPESRDLFILVNSSSSKALITSSLSQSLSHTLLCGFQKKKSMGLLTMVTNTADFWLFF